MVCAQLPSDVLAWITRLLSDAWNQLNFLWGVIAGSVATILVDRMREPKLKIENSTTHFWVDNVKISKNFVGKPLDPTDPLTTVRAYRARVRNVQKRLLSSAAENCVAWLDVEGAEEAYQLSWVGPNRLGSVTINVGDFREIDLCGLDTRFGCVVAPTERGYDFPNPRLIGHEMAVPIKAALRVTSSNGKSARRNVTIDSDAEARKNALLKISME
jgi:hypothetical protein